MIFIHILQDHYEMKYLNRCGQMENIQICLALILHTVLIVYGEQVNLYQENDKQKTILHVRYNDHLVEMALLSLSLWILALMISLPVYILKLFSYVV